MYNGSTSKNKEQERKQQINNKNKKQAVIWTQKDIS